MVKTKPSFKFEKNLWSRNVEYVVGIDEVGRGAFAGPIVAAAVVFPRNLNPNVIDGVNDSKLLKYNERQRLSTVIKNNALTWVIEEVDIRYINKQGIGKANTAVFRKALNAIIKELKTDNYAVLIDGFHKKYLPGGLKKQQGIIKGDTISFSIAAASILAKVHRDNLMKKYSYTFPNYKFSSNKGYGTAAHKEALKLYGLTAIHRTSFNLSQFL